MATVTLATMKRKIRSIIKQKKNYAKNIKNYLDFMESKVMIKDYILIQGKDERLHVTIDLWSKTRQSMTFNVKKLRDETCKE